MSTAAKAGKIRDMFNTGTAVRLLASLGGYPAGTIAAVVRVKLDGTCVVEFAAGVQLEVDCRALAPAKAS